MRSATEAVRTALGSAVPLRAHFHNTRGLGIANALAARELGVETLDASIEVSEDALRPGSNGKYSDGRAALRA